MTFAEDWARCKRTEEMLLHYAKMNAPRIINSLTTGRLVDGNVLNARMSLRQLARRMKRSPTYISRIKNGTTEISPDAFMDLEKIAGDTQ